MLMRQANRKVLCHSKRILREAKDIEGDEEDGVEVTPVDVGVRKNQTH